MAVTTFEDFYNLVKDNIVYFEYPKNDHVFKFKGTLNRDFIPASDINLKQYDNSTFYSNFYLGLWEGSDSDRIILNERMELSSFRIPGWLKVYCVVHSRWFNIEIDKILSLEVVDS